MKHLLLIPAVLVAACSSSEPTTQVISGRIAPGYPVQVTRVKVTTSSVLSGSVNTVLAEAPVAADGSFRIRVPATREAHLQLIGPSGQSTLVFPRRTGGTERSFLIRPNGAAIDLGLIHFAGDVSTTAVVFKSETEGTTCDDDGEDDNGNLCVDDDDSDHGTCGEVEDDDDHDGSDDGSDDGASSGSSETEDSHDGSDDDGGECHQADSDGHEDEADGGDVGDSVAEHNFPSDGCVDDDGDDSDDDHGDDGTETEDHGGSDDGSGSGSDDGV